MTKYSLLKKNQKHKEKCPFSLNSNKKTLSLFLQKIKDFVSSLLSSDIFDFKEEIDKRTLFLEYIVEKLYLNLKQYLEISEMYEVSLSSIDSYLLEKSSFLKEFSKPISTSIMDVYINYLLFINEYTTEEEAKKCLIIHMTKGESTMIYYFNSHNFFEKDLKGRKNFNGELTTFFKYKKISDNVCHFAKSKKKREYINIIWDFIDSEFYPKVKEQFIGNIDKYKVNKNSEALFILGKLDK